MVIIQVHIHPSSNVPVLNVIEEQPKQNLVFRQGKRIPKAN
jgi:hypothetical protein